MRSFAILKNFTSSEAKKIVVRNLNRILDMAIVDMDIENSTITFLCAGKAALENTKRELNSLGFPIMRLNIQDHKKLNVDTSARLV